MLYIIVSVTWQIAFLFPLLCEQDSVICNQSIQEELFSVHPAEGAAGTLFSATPLLSLSIYYAGIKGEGSESASEAGGSSFGP